MYGLVATASRVGGLGAALAVLVIGSFRGISGWALFSRVALVFLFVSIVLNVAGLVMLRSFLTAVVADQDTRKDAVGPKRGRESIR
jgi:hypothetical protein